MRTSVQFLECQYIDDIIHAVRKAYKKKALETHPDRFSAKPAAEKSVAEEEFRKVSRSYWRRDKY